MSAAYSATTALTAEQRAVVEQPVDALTLVTAQAGAGKTHTLVRRLDRLVAEEDLSPGEVLVLTFSRAAVRELRERMAKHGEAARYVRAQTFDSWALDLLMQVDAVGEWQARSFEARIEAATNAIDRGLADDLYEDLRHVIIDEVQDLVGSRRLVVEALLEHFECGFTVVGDPAQSIYGFTVKNPAERAGETNQFFEWLRTTFPDELTELSLTENFRAKSDEARAALGFGPRLRELSERRNADGEELLHELLNTLLDSDDFGGFDQLTADALTSYDGTTAILCRTNGQALVVSGELNKLSVTHRLQRSARDRAVPAWVGLLIARCEASTLSRDRFDELVGELPLPADANPGQLWRLLLRTGPRRGSGRILDLARLRTAIATGRFPDELTAQPPASLIVSSFHRAKGLEFDRVIVVDPGFPRPQMDESRKKRYVRDAAEEARLLYVAMTRPRHELYRIGGLDTQNVRVDDRTGRWGRYFFQYWRRDGVAIITGDVAAEQPAGRLDFDDDAVELQRYIAAKMWPGDEVVLERLYPEPIGIFESPPYLIRHEGRVIGTVSEQFRTELYKHLKTSENFVPQNFPATISGVYVDAVETVAGSEAAGIRAGLGDRGIWLAPRLVGLSTFTWDKKSRETELDVTAQ